MVRSYKFVSQFFEANANTTNCWGTDLKDREKAKAGAQGAAAATQRTARRTKLKAEIMGLNRDIQKAKAEFGVLSYEMVCGGDLAGAQRVAFEKKEKIDMWKNAITAKRGEIQKLNEEAMAAGEKIPPSTGKSEYYDDDEPPSRGEVVI